MNDILIQLGQWTRPYQFQAAMAIIATLLVIFGDDINKAIKKLFVKQHFIVRCCAFILICAFGYGLLTVWLTSWLSSQLSSIPDLYIFPSITGIFITLGVYAQKQRHI
jgi:hypothetical protein